MKKIRTLIVDDELLAREGIATMLQKDEEVAVVGMYSDGMQALEAIRTQQPDLVYLDVQMPLLNGFEMLQRLPAGESPTVIFVTAFDHYAIQAFEAAAVGYLLKPFGDGRFNEALNRAKRQIRHADLNLEWQQAVASLKPWPENGHSPAQPAPPAPHAPSARLSFKVGGDYLFIDANDIGWIEAQGDLVKVYAGGQVHRVRESLQDVEQRLDRSKYTRIHRSFIVNTTQIKRIAPTLNGDYTVLMGDGAKLRLSRNYRHALKTLLPAHFA